MPVRRSPDGVRAAVGRGITTVAQWLRKPLTSLHLILGVFGLLTLFGLVMVLSASSVVSFTAGGSSYSVFARQLMFCAGGLVLFWAGLRIPPTVLRSLAPVALVVGVLALVAVLIRSARCATGRGPGSRSARSPCSRRKR